MTIHALTGSLAAAVLALALPLDAPAQQTRAASFDANFGVETVLASGEYRAPHRGSAVDGLLAMRLQGAGRGALLAGLSAGTPWAWTSTSICLPASTGGCIPTFPQFLKVGALLGWENAGATLRAMSGPAYVRADGNQAFGLQGRVDGAAPISRHLALVASVRGTMIPNYRGDTFGVYALGVGIRLR